MTHQERMQQLRIVGPTAVRTLGRCASSLRHARTFGVSAKIERSINSIEHVEIAEDRREHRVHQAEIFRRRRMAPSRAPPRPAQTSRRPPAACSRRSRHRPWSRGPIVAQNGRAELHPGPVLGALQRILRMQLAPPCVSSIYSQMTLLSNSATSPSSVATTQHRHLAERRDFQEPVRLVGEIDIDPLERRRPSRSARSPRAAHRDRACG